MLTLSLACCAFYTVKHVLYQTTLLTLVKRKYLLHRVTILDSLSIGWPLDLSRSYIKSYYKFEFQEYFLYTSQQYAPNVYILYNFQMYFVFYINYFWNEQLAFMSPKQEIQQNNSYFSFNILMFTPIDVRFFLLV